MEFGWINLYGACAVIVMLIPNIIYAMKNREAKNNCNNRLILIIEQVGRFACIILMWLPFQVLKFGFSSVEAMLVYFLGNTG